MAGICVYAEQEQGIVAPVTFEILRCALERKKLTGEEICLLVDGGEQDAILPQLTVTGVDRIYYQPSSAARFSDDVRSARCSPCGRGFTALVRNLVRSLR